MYTPPTIEEAKEKLGRVIKRGADFVYVSSRCERWALDAIALMQKEGYLGPCEESGDEQSTIWKFRFTKKARKELV